MLLFALGCRDPDVRPEDPGSTSEPTPSTRSAIWRPAPGDYSDWDWQITEPYDLSVHRAMVDLDLFDLAVRGSELVYDDHTVAVPTGPLAGKIDQLHGEGTVVVCYLDTGAFESYRPDAEEFPGWHDKIHDIPDRPDPPEPGSIIGWNSGWNGERWLDLRATDRILPIVRARLDLAVHLGCDGVEPDQNNPLDNHPGFDLTLEDQLSWYEAVAAEAHARGLSVGMKNGHDQPGAVDRLVEAFDWALPEECAQYRECGDLAPFVDHGKAVFAVDYRNSVDPDAACADQVKHGFDGLVKDEPPSGAYRKSCAAP